jgi:hypothetical protein
MQGTAIYSKCDPIYIGNTFIKLTKALDLSEVKTKLDIEEWDQAWFYH